MDWEVAGIVAEIIGAIAVVVSLLYLATQIRQNTAQQKREELGSIQHGQNDVVAQLRDPSVLGGYVRVADERNPSAEDRAAAFAFIIQYLNHFQIVQELYKGGTLDQERYELWAGVAVSIIAPKGIWKWWNEGNLRLAFHTEVRELIEQKIQEAESSSVPITELWSVFSGELWDHARAKSEKPSA